MLIFAVDGSPSESDLLKVLNMVPEWYHLAVALGVPVESANHFQRIKTGGIEALCYWRYGESGQNYPTSWRFLLDKIEECYEQDVVRDVKKTFGRSHGEYMCMWTYNCSHSLSHSDTQHTHACMHTHTYSSILCHVDSQPADIVEKYKDQFLLYVDAHAIARKLEIKNVIPNRVSHKIENSAPEDVNDILFLHLQSHSSPETLHKLCDVMTSMSGYPNMNELGRTMKEDLPSVGYAAESNKYLC